MFRLFSHPRFLAIYSGTLTLVFVATTATNLWHGPRRFSAAEQHDFRHPDFDQLTVHRINIVEPDGTPRLIISDKAEFPGGFYMGKETSRADRSSAGMLFNDDEGTENGGMLFGGNRSADGQFHSYGHLSFDGYEQDQSMSLDSNQDGDERTTAYQINDNIGDTLFTPEVMAGFAALHAMPEGPAKQKAIADFKAKYPYALHARASLERDADKSAVLRLRDPFGHTRILLRVASDGTPTMQFLDAAGKVTHEWPYTPPASGPEKK
jgi:hypothetical protein